MYINSTQYCIIVASDKEVAPARAPTLRKPGPQVIPQQEGVLPPPPLQLLLRAVADRNLPFSHSSLGHRSAGLTSRLPYTDDVYGSMVSQLALDLAHVFIHHLDGHRSGCMGQDLRGLT